MNSDKIFGGWSQTLSRAPLEEFNTVMYGMVTEFKGLTTGTLSNPGWSPETLPNTPKRPSYLDWQGKTFWTYGGGGGLPLGTPSSSKEVERIVAATVNYKWDGVDFDNESSMNTDNLVQAMSSLKNSKKGTSYGFIAGYSYNNPDTENGRKITEEVKKIINSGYCDRLVHYCYAQSMWSMNDIVKNVGSSLEKTIHYGMPEENIILALTTRGLTDENLSYFLNQISEKKIGGLYVWNYHELKPAHLKMITEHLGLVKLAV